MKSIICVILTAKEGNFRTVIGAGSKTAQVGLDGKDMQYDPWFSDHSEECYDKGMMCSLDFRRGFPMLLLPNMLAQSGRPLYRRVVWG